MSLRIQPFNRLRQDMRGGVPDDVELFLLRTLGNMYRRYR